MEKIATWDDFEFETLVWLLLVQSKNKPEIRGSKKNWDIVLRLDGTYFSESLMTQQQMLKHFTELLEAVHNKLKVSDGV